MVRRINYVVLTALALAGQLAFAQFGSHVGVFFKTQGPNAPSGLTAAAASGTQINLSWTDNSPDETSFTIDRSPNGSAGWTTITTTAANVVSYSDTGLANATIYYYRVYAVNSSGASDYTTTANATTLAPPNAPSGLSATAASSTQINLSWTDNSSNETGFKIDRSANGSTGWITITTTAANVVSYSNGSLASSTTYYYRVYAVNGTDSSAYSNTANATTPCTPPHSSATYTWSGSWSVPGCVTSVTIQVWGGGGGGGSAPWGGGGSGAGGGGYASKVVSVTPGQAIGFTVGGGGSNLSPGGDSYCGGMVAYGGGGGQDDSDSGGAGGGASGGTTNLAGGWGGASGGDGGAGAGGGGGGGYGGWNNPVIQCEWGGGGSIPGGGGGGGGGCNGTPAGGGLGAAGQVTFSY
ncbi:MAG: fibronectin type III domain-containing protein [Proteobacteria bacterium]|nr:fibronectin type III domain-containing protein [Pseudomonadota bacterium]